MRATGRHKRKEPASIRKIVLRILEILPGLISLIFAILLYGTKLRLNP